MHCYPQFLETLDPKEGNGNTQAKESLEATEILQRCTWYALCAVTDEPIWRAHRLLNNNSIPANIRKLIDHVRNDAETGNNHHGKEEAIEIIKKCQGFLLIVGGDGKQGKDELVWRSYRIKAGPIPPDVLEMFNNARKAELRE